MLNSLKSIVKDAEAYFAAHPQFVTWLGTAVAAALANFGVHVSATTLVVIVMAVMSVLSAVTGNAAMRASQPAAKARRGA